MKHRIVVIDDEVAIRDSLKMILEYDGYDTLLAPSGQAGLVRASSGIDPDLVLLDVKMPGTRWAWRSCASSASDGRARCRW